MAPISKRPARAMSVDATTVRSFAELKRVLVCPALEGPVVIVANVQESAPTVKPPLDYVAIKERLKAASAAGRPAHACDNTRAGNITVEA